MTTRQYTKILNSNPTISTFKIDNQDIRGMVTITRFKPKEEKKITKGNGDVKITFHETVGNEVDVKFEGLVRSSNNAWFDSKQYKKTRLTRWLRNTKYFYDEVLSHVRLIGGNKDLKIKKIELL